MSITPVCFEPHNPTIKKYKYVESGLSSVYLSNINAHECPECGESEIDIEDNFFALGGHSLLAIQAMNKINKKLNCQLKIRDFLNGTLGTLALQATEVESENILEESPEAPTKKTIKSLFSSKKE